MSRGKPSLRDPTILLIGILAVTAILSSWRFDRDVPAVDFYQFWVIGQAATGGQPGNIYSDLERERIGSRFLDQAGDADNPALLRTARHRKALDTFSTPFLYSTFRLFSSGDYDRDLDRYRILGLLLLVLSVATLCRLLGYGVAATLAMVTLFACWFAPSRSDLLVGNVNHLQLGGLVLFLWISQRFPTDAGHVAGGVLLGLGALFKPNTAPIIGLLLVAWLVRHQYRKLLLEAGGVVVGALAAFGISSLTFGGATIWWNWFVALRQLRGDLITIDLGNFAPSLLFSASPSPSPSPMLNGLLALVCGGLAVGVVVRGLLRGSDQEARDPSGFEDILVVALAGLVTLLASPLSWLHYFVAAIPMLLVALRPAGGDRPLGTASALARVAAYFALLAVMVKPMVMVFGFEDPRDRVILVGLGTTILFVLGLRETLARRVHPSGSQARA